MIRPGVSTTGCPGLARCRLAWFALQYCASRKDRQHCGMNHGIHLSTGLSRGYYIARAKGLSTDLFEVKQPSPEVPIAQASCHI